MAAMVQQVPDEYFRKRVAESADVEEAKPKRPQATTVKTVVPRRVREGLTLRAAAILFTMALATAFVLGRLVLFPPVTPSSPATPAITQSFSPEPSPEALAPYDGPVVAVPAVTAQGECQEGGTRESPLGLVDEDPDTLWRCRGNGVGEKFTVVFEGPVSLAGIRVVNGNTAWDGRYAVERRITALRWTFADGSYFDQGLAANDRNPQEVRFPVLSTDRATVEVLTSTVPGEAADNSDAVSISTLEFLGPVQ